MAGGKTDGFSAVPGLSESIQVSKQPHDFGNGTSAYLYYRKDGTEAGVEGSDVQPLSAFHQDALTKMLRESGENAVENFRRYYAACVGASGVKTAPGSHVTVRGIRYYATYVFNHGDCPTVEALKLAVLLCDYAASGNGAVKDEAASRTMQGLISMMCLEADQLPQLLNFVSWCPESTPSAAEFKLGASIMEPFLAFLEPKVVTACGTGDAAQCAALAIDGFPKHSGPVGVFKRFGSNGQTALVLGHPSRIEHLQQRHQQKITLGGMLLHTADNSAAAAAVLASGAEYTLTPTSAELSAAVSSLLAENKYEGAQALMERHPSVHGLSLCSHGITEKSQSQSLVLFITRYAARLRVLAVGELRDEVVDSEAVMEAASSGPGLISIDLFCQLPVGCAALDLLLPSVEAVMATVELTGGSAAPVPPGAAPVSSTYGGGLIHLIWGAGTRTEHAARASTLRRLKEQFPDCSSYGVVASGVTYDQDGKDVSQQKKGIAGGWFRLRILQYPPILHPAYLTTCYSPRHGKHRRTAEQER
jgi:hypothetical protein